MALWKKMTQYKKILSSQKKKIIFGRETGFPTDVENMVVGGLFEIWWVGLVSTHGRRMGV